MSCCLRLRLRLNVFRLPVLLYRYYYHSMVRSPLSPQERMRGERLGTLLRQARGPRSMTEIAALSGVPVETLRKIETGRIPTPAFFTVASLARVLGLTLEQIASHCAVAQTAEPPAPATRMAG
jgi:DNA-binding XRE family transcriptional regulator